MIDASQCIRTHKYHVYAYTSMAEFIITVTPLASRPESAYSWGQVLPVILDSSEGPGMLLSLLVVKSVDHHLLRKTYYSPSPADAADRSGAWLSGFSFGLNWGSGLRFNLQKGCGVQLKIKLRERERVYGHVYAYAVQSV